MEEVKRGLGYYDGPYRESRDEPGHDDDVVQMSSARCRDVGASTGVRPRVFIGFCIVVGFTKTKKTAGGKGDGRQESGRANQPSADGLFPPNRAARPGRSAQGSGTCGGRCT